MNPSSLFIRRPVATTLITVAIALIGIAAYFELPVSALPAMDLPTISIQANLAGASPSVMATTIASPLERTLGQIADVTEMTSESGTGNTRIILQFGLDRDINGAARDVEASINAARALLPATLTSNPSYHKVNPANRPIILLGLTSDTMTTPQVYDAADTILEQALSQVQGVGEVDLGGGASPSVRVEMNPLALNKYGIGLEDVRAAITSTNAFTPKGAVTNGSQRFQIYTNDQATEAAQYRDVIVAYRSGAPVRLRDVAEIVDGPEDVHQLGLVDGKPGIVVRVTQAPGANVVATIDRIHALLPTLSAQLPASIHLVQMVDNSQSIRAALADVERTLLIAIVLVVLVVLVFLRNGRATLIPGVAVTVSLLGTLGLMYVLHFSLDNLSLMALTVATGFVVDDAIVVLENITRHVEAGMPRYKAAMVGAGEVGFTVLSMSISLIAVFIPILMMGGVVGLLFREFAMTLSSAILISLFVSLTATPMMASLLIDEHPGQGEHRKVTFWSRLSDRFEAGFEWLLGIYEKGLNWALDNRFIVLLSLIATIFLTVYLYIIVPKGFFPQEDTGLLIGGLQADQASSFDSVAKKVKALQAIVMHDPAVTSSAAFTYTPGGFMFVSLKPEKQRPGVTSDEVIGRLRPELSKIAGGQLFLQSAQDLQIGGRQGNAQYQYTLQSDDLDALHSWSDKLMNALKKVPDLTDVNTDQENHALETYVRIDRQTAARFGLTSKQVDATLNDAFGQSIASIIYKPQNQYHVIMEVAQRYQQGPDALGDLYVTPASTGSSATARTTSVGTGGGSASKLPVLTAGAGALSGVTNTANTVFVSSGNGLATSSSAAPSSGSASSGSTSSSENAGSSNSNITATGSASSGPSNTTVSTTSGSANSTTATIGGTATSGAGVASSSTGGATAVSTGVAISTSPEIMTPLSAFASYALQSTPLEVNHQGQSAAATLSFNLAPGKSLSDAQLDIAQVQQQIGMPNSVTGSFQGTAKVFAQSLSNEPVLILAALVAIYIVLGILYESYVHPLTVLSTIPSAGVGAVLALLLFHIEFSIIALIGVVLLIGIVKKNAIMIIDFALVAEREQGLSSHDAIYQACILRFRPILMTTCAAIMGAVPLAIGLGEGGELRQPLGVAIIGGLVVSQVLTLLTTPVVA